MSSFSQLLGNIKKGIINNRQGIIERNKSTSEPLSKPLLVDYESSDNQISSKPDIFHLCLLFIIIDDFPHEILWRLWLDTINSESFYISIYIHAKFPHLIKSKWVRNRLVSFRILAEWGSLNLTKIMLSLLNEAIFKEPTADLFCFLSESCVPLYNANETMNLIQNTSKILNIDYKSTNWVNYTNKPHNGYVQISQVSNYI